MKNTAMSRFTDNVLAILDDRGTTITWLAAECGISRPNLSKILNGREGVTLERAERIAEALSVELSDLVSKQPLVLT